MYHLTKYTGRGRLNMSSTAKYTRLEFLSLVVGIDFWINENENENENGDEGEKRKINELLNESLKFILNSIFKLCAVNVGVGHRNKINIFDFTKLMQSLRVPWRDLFSFLKWTKNKRDKGTDKDNRLMYRSTMPCTSGITCDLSFGIDEGNYDAKRAGFEYFPPLPSSFSYKFTPIFGKRDEDALTVLKRRTDEKLKVENNFFRSSSEEGINLRIINYDEI